MAEFRVQILPEDMQTVINEQMIEIRDLRIQLASARRIIRTVGVHEEPGERFVASIDEEDPDAQ
jgi:hypothetical protein